MENQNTADTINITLVYRIGSSKIFQEITVPKKTTIEKLLPATHVSKLAKYSSSTDGPEEEYHNQGNLTPNQSYIVLFRTQKDKSAFKKAVEALNKDPHSIDGLAEKSRAEKAERTKKPYHPKTTTEAFLKQQKESDKIRDFRRSLYGS